MIARSVLGLALLPFTLSAQAPADSAKAAADSTRRVVKLAPIGVTATRIERPVFRTPTPLLVIDSSTIREEAPNGVADLFRNLPGVDVTGVGPNQGRLMIRGQRGQRILLAEDGIRLNNSRRQQDFGELPALTDINAVSRVEVIRGPASVLYGTDAIGGVVNQITMKAPGRSSPRGLSGDVFGRYGSAGAEHLYHGRLAGRFGRLGFAVTAGYRTADPYTAPAGTFGNLTLPGPTKVNDTGVLDRNYTVDLGLDLASNQRLSLRASRYEARDAGFGYVSASDLGDQSGTLIRLLYPRQNVTRVSATYAATAVRSAVADRVSASVWTNQNDRLFDQMIEIPFGPPLPPAAGIGVQSRNVTNLGSYGTRLEAAKVLGGRHSLVYGVDWYLDHSTNADTSTTTVRGFGPDQVERSDVPTLPNANLWSAGAFAQADFAVTGRLSLGAGVRGQTVRSETQSTPGIAASRAGVVATNQAVVGGLSASYRVTPEINLVGTVGRAFRAPNLVERYFDGATPEGNGYQVANPDLEPETSLDVDLGVKIRTGRIYAEATYFRNTISNGIRIVALDTMVGPLPAFENQNVDRIRDQGVEVLAEAQVGAGFSLLGHFTKLRSRDADRNSPVGDAYGTKIGGELGWRDPRGRFFAAYEIRHQGERKDIDLPAGPIGSVLPPFTVQNVRAGTRVATSGGTHVSLVVAVMNLTDELYAEASNVSFFRPEPRRQVLTTLRFEF